MSTAPSSVPTPVDAKVEILYEPQSYRIRLFEQRAAALYPQGNIPGFVHLDIGREDTAVGAYYFLRAEDRSP